MATPKQVQRRGRLSLVLGTVFAAFTFAAVAYAADIQTDAVLSTTLAAPTQVAVGNNSFDIKVWATGNINNAAATGKAFVVNKYFMSTAGAVTPSTDVTDRTELTFTTNTNYSQSPPCGATAATSIQGCLNNPFIVNATLVVASSTLDNTTGTLTVATIGSIALTADSTPDTGIVQVDAPVLNTAPAVSVTGVINGASYNKGSVPAATCDVTDAEDGNSSFAATLSAITGTYASDGIGSQTASCSYTDGGGLTASAEETYSIVDPSAPTIGYTLTPASADGSNGWYNGNVTLAWTVTENESPNSLQKTGCLNQNITADQAASYSCSATSAGGSGGPVEVTIKRDGSAPSVVYTSASPAANGAGWHKTDVVATFTATDNLSGFSALALLTQTGTNTTSGQGTSVTVGSPAFTDWAGNTALAGAATSIGFSIDKTKPTISGSATPAPNSAGWNNTNVTVAWTCGDTLSGIASCSPDEILSSESSALSASGTAVDVADNSETATVSGIKIDKTAPTVTCNTAPSFGPTLGTVTAKVVDALSGPNPASGDASALATSQNGGNVSVTGKDNAGNEASASCAYHVARGGFLAPIDSPPVLNVAKWGRIVPVKFSLIYDGVAVSDPTANVTISVQKLSSCSLASGTDSIEVYEAAGSANSGAAFRYTDPHWTYNLDTSGYVVNSCYKLDVQYLGATAGSYLLKVTK